MVEKMISLIHTHLSEVKFTSTGQLLPFLVGLFTSLSSVLLVIKSVMIPRKDGSKGPPPSLDHRQGEFDKYPRSTQPRPRARTARPVSNSTPPGYDYAPLQRLPLEETGGLAPNQWPGITL